MGIVYTINLIIHLYLSPHGAVVGHLKVQVLMVHDRVAAVYYHVALTSSHVREILFVGIGVFAITALVVVFLHTGNVYLLLFHLCQNVLCHESGSLSSEHGYIVRRNLDSLFNFRIFC